MPQLFRPEATQKYILPLKVLFRLIFVALLLTLLQPYVTYYMLWACLAYFLMVSGLLFKRQKFVHVSFMSIAIILDLALVLVLEVNRDALKTALEFSMGPLQQLHIGFSTLALFLYFPIVFLGVKRLRHIGGSNTRKWHIRLGITGFVFRTLGFILMFSLFKR